MARKVIEGGCDSNRPVLDFRVSDFPLFDLLIAQAWERIHLAANTVWLYSLTKSQAISLTISALSQFPF
jgi:hypothetical protein